MAAAMPGSAAQARGKGNWFAVCAFALIAAATQMLWLTFAPITTEAAGHYGVSETMVGVLSIIFPLLYVVLAIPWGLMLDRWFRLALLIGAVLTALGGVVRALGPDAFAFALVGQIICAAAQPLVLNSVAKLAADYLPRAQRPVGIAVGSAGLFVGMLVSFLLGEVFSADIRLLLLAEAAIGVVAAVLIGVAMTQPARFAQEIDIAPGETASEAAAHPLRTSWSDPIIRLLVALITVGNGVFVALTTWLQPFLAPAGVNPDTAGLMLIVLVVAGIVGAATVPAGAARRGTQTTWMFLAISVGAVGCVALAVAPTGATGFIVTAVLGFLILAVLPMVLDMVERRSGPAAATATSLVWLAGNAGGVVISVAVGALIGTPALGFGLMALIMLAAGLPTVFGLRRRLIGGMERRSAPSRATS